VARLCVTDGIVRVRAATPGEVAERVVDLWSTSVVFRAGHRIRVQVTSSSFPRWDRNLNTGEPEGTATTAPVARQQVFHDAARRPASSCPWSRPDKRRPPRSWDRSSSTGLIPSPPDAPATQAAMQEGRIRGEIRGRIIPRL
jgi:hypothetical protein